MRLGILLAASLTLGLAACDEPRSISPTTQRIGGGAAAGALTGLAIGSLSGNAGAGALIGAGVGGAGGFAFDQSRRAQQRSFDQGFNQGRASSR